MGWSFRESIKVLPGIRLNFSRRGIGASIGPKGLHLGFGGGRAPRITGGIGPLHYYQSLGPGQGEHGRAVPTRQRRAHFGLLALLIAGTAGWFGWKALSPRWKSALFAPVTPPYSTPADPSASAARQTTILPTAASDHPPAATPSEGRHVSRTEESKHRGSHTPNPHSNDS